jgi:signal recognition particle GTPase
MFDVRDGFRNSMVGVGLAAALLAGAACDESSDSPPSDEQTEQQAAESTPEESPSEEMKADASAQPEETEGTAAEKEAESSLEGPVDDQELETFVEAYRAFKKKTNEIDDEIKRVKTKKEAKKIAEKKQDEIEEAIRKAGMPNERFGTIRERLKSDDKLRARVSEMAPDLQLRSEETRGAAGPDAGSP